LACRPISVSLHLAHLTQWAQLALICAAQFQPIEGGIKRGLLQRKHFGGDLLNALGGRPTVFRFKRGGLEKQQVAATRREVV
jgi:hypothetical protein